MGLSSGGNGYKPGDLKLHPTGTAPAGWLACNGAAVSRTTYAALFAVIGTTYGVGDGSTTFNLPQSGGEYLRFWDNGRGIDPARAIGSAQAQSGGTHIEFGMAGGGSVYYVGNGPNMTVRNIALLLCIKA